MYSIRSNGDNLAHEFSKLMGNNQSLEKVAEHRTDDALDQSGSGSFSENDIADLLVDNANNVVDNNVEDVSNEIEDMTSYAEDQDRNKTASVVEEKPSNGLSEDPHGQYVMSGLGKIAAGLRTKGESFAADVVEATAFSIRGDLLKEAKRKSTLLDSLDKLASEFVTCGDNFAADMVRATVNKIR